MSAPSPTVIVPTMGGYRLGRMLDSLAAQSVEHEAIVVDNGPDGSVATTVAEHHPAAQVVRTGENLGYTRAINLGARRAAGETIVLLNDDCVCEPEFVERIVAPIDPAAGVVMAAGVMRDWRDPGLIDSAGMELDPTLLVFDYLNGEPLSVLEGDVADPIGPSGAAAAFDRATFLAVGGFDESLFAYWEDVDLVLRLRRLGFGCRLAPGALGDHEHSATLGSGSARKNYLMGFGRGYVLRKWGVVSPRRAPGLLARELSLCAGQAIVDRNVAGVRGRIAGFRAARERERYPEELELFGADGAVATLRRRATRRARLASRPARPRATTIDALAVFHLAETTGPSRSLEAEVEWLSRQGQLTSIIPGSGDLAKRLGTLGDVVSCEYEALTTLPSGPLSLLSEARQLARDVRTFRALIREREPDVVLSVTTMLPAVPLAARLERVPVVVYCGELFGRGHRGAVLRAFAGRRLLRLTSRLAGSIIACSRTVAAQFPHPDKVRTVYPPVDDRYARGDGRRLRESFGIQRGAPLLASVGYLTEGRGQDLLVRAMPRVLERFGDARCLIAGKPFPRPQDLAYRERLLALVRDLGLERSVTVAGHVEQIADVYAAADVVVNPARASESFGRVAFEAAIAGTPAVVSRVGAIPELLRDRESAMIVEAEDSDAIATAALQLLDDPELGERLVAGARAVVAQRLRPELSLEGFREAIQLALRR